MNILFVVLVMKVMLIILSYRSLQFMLTMELRMVIIF